MSDEDDGDTLRASELPLPGGDFRLFVLKLNFQAMIALGLLENPVTGQTSRNLEHARMVIEDLRMLKDRTRGNLSAEEDAHLAKALSDLQFHYVNVVEEHPSPGDASESEED